MVRAYQCAPMGTSKIWAINHAKHAHQIVKPVRCWANVPAATMALVICRDRASAPAPPPNTIHPCSIQAQQARSAFANYAYTHVNNASHPHSAHPACKGTSCRQAHPV